MKASHIIRNAMLCFNIRVQEQLPVITYDDDTFLYKIYALIEVEKIGLRSRQSGFSTTRLCLACKPEVAEEKPALTLGQVTS